MWEHKSNSNYAFSFSLLVSFLFFILAAGTSQKIGCESLYQLGDSIEDTGNAIRILPSTSFVAHPPYGETFPGYPIGRFSDGRLIIDFIAMALGLPLLNPYLAKNASFSNGVNFAVGGSTTLNSSFYMEKGIRVLPVPSLNVQLSWFKTYLNSTCSTPKECADKFGRSLTFVGEIGYTDIAYAIFDGRPVEEIRSYIPLVIEGIINTIREVIRTFASKSILAPRVMVPGNFPLGCFPFARAAATNDSTAYDDLGCLKSLNNLSTFQNNGLQRSLQSLRKEFPTAIIHYVDYYNAFLSLLREASNLGFDRKTLLKACCGVEGQYNPFSKSFCGNMGVPVCPDPDLYIYWDGVHLTQKAYYFMSKIIMNDLEINCI